jgi:transmembrane sensor
MNGSPPPMQTPQEAQREAARWFSRLRARSPSRSEQAAFEAWLQADPEHRDAYLRVTEVWNTAGLVRADPEILDLRERALARYPASQSKAEGSGWIWLAGGGLAACIAAAAAAFLAFADAPAPMQVFRTGVGQTASIGLVDGSRLTLDTDTQVRTRITPRKRLIYLDRGRAYFKVAKDRSRPFIVAASGNAVTATGTAFEVTSEPQRFEVLLVEGHVRVSTGESKASLEHVVYTDLAPGGRLSASGSRSWTLTRVDLGKELSWMDGQLRFDNKPLGEIVAEMNRYSRRKIVIEDPQVAARPIYGAFMAGDVDQFVRALVDYRIAKVRTQDDDVVVLTGR